LQIPEIVNEDGWVNVDDLADSVILYRKIAAEEASYTDKAMSGTKVVSVIDVKGGVKKTTTAVHLALGINRFTGKTVMIGDCDQYHSVQDWYTKARDGDPETGKKADPWSEDVTVVTADGDNFHHEIIEAVQEVRPAYLVLDTPPNDEEAALRALLLSDVMLTPTGPFSLDLGRLVYGLRVAAKAAKLRGRTIEPLALLTGCKMGTNLYKKARLDLEKRQMAFVNMPVRDLLAQASAFGTSVPDLNDYAFVPNEVVPMLDRIKKEG
jgi:chromosome partitioning protein